MPLVRKTLVDARPGRPQMAAEDRKVLLSLRLDREVVERFRATGPGWQTRIGEVLANHLKRSTQKRGVT